METPAQKRIKNMIERAKSGKKELTLKQQRLVGAYLDPDSPTYLNKSQSGLAAGYSKTHPEVAFDYLTPSIKRAIEVAFEKEGLSPDTLAQKHKQLLMKKEIRYNPKTEEFEETDRPDTQSVKTALDMAYRVRGDYAPEKVLTGHMNLNQILEQIQTNEQPIVRESQPQ